MQENPSQFQVYNASAGSGKTFTLVKEYLKILLFTGKSFDAYRFQRILAITFTNKAAAEMKERVLGNLRSFASGEKSDMFQVIQDETTLTADVIQERSQRVLHNILQNYSAFNITTIDAFTHRIIRNFSFDLGLSLNFDVEMDSQQLLSEAVDLLISKIGIDKEITKVLIDYSLEKTDDDKTWDISRDLKEFARVLLNENDAKQLKKLDKNTIDDFVELNKYLKEKNRETEEKFKEIGQKGLEIIESMQLEHNDFYRSMLPNHFKNLAFSFEKVKFFDDSKLRERIEENTFYAKSKSDDVKAAIEAILPPLLELYATSEQLYEQYVRNSLVLKSLIPLATLKHINASLNELKEQNNIRLNAEFNQIISNQIKNEPAPFIYERLGEKFQYYFIDEMQDTSQLQWTNLIPLIENALISETLTGETGRLMLVGDAKQAIYRWRGGKAEQFIDLTASENPFSIDKKLENLDTNFRSYSEIIDFNNRFFKHVSSFFDASHYEQLYKIGNDQKTTSKEGGYVQVSLVEKDRDDPEKELVFPRKVLEIIQNLDKDFELSDICILVRKKKEGIDIANYLTEQDIPIISSETLLLKNNSQVDFIINLLQFLSNTDDKESLANALYLIGNQTIKNKDIHRFLQHFLEVTPIEVFEKLKKYGYIFSIEEFSNLPFYDAIEYIIRAFNLVKKAESYILTFLDVILNYEQKKGGTLLDFLNYWELKKDTLCVSIPDGQNAVKIMTIHKSKGLEFPVVIYPYDLEIYREINHKVWYENLEKEQYLNLETSLVDYSKKLKHSGEFGRFLFEQRRGEKQLDNLNLLYVALTRAVEQLYIITEKKTRENELSNARFYSDFFIDFLKIQTDEKKWDTSKNDYQFGSSKRVKKQQEKKENKGTLKQEKFISSPWKNHNISIVANASKLWDSKQEESINYGNLVHEILSKIISFSDVDPVIEEYVFNGLITIDESNSIKNKISEVINHSELEEYYQPNLKVLNEQELVTEFNEIFIPDRLVFQDNSVSIIDYKTGVYKKSHESQLLNYARVVEKVGYVIKELILVYVDVEIEIKKVK